MGTRADAVVPGKGKRTQEMKGRVERDFYVHNEVQLNLQCKENFIQMTFFFQRCQNGFHSQVDSNFLVM